MWWWGVLVGRCAGQVGTVGRALCALECRMNGGWCEWVLDVARSGRAEGAAGERPLAPVDVPSSPPACHVPAACLRDQPPGPPSSARSVAYGVIAGLVSYVAIHTPFWVVDAVKKRWFPQDEGEDSPRFNRMQRRCAPGRGEAPDRWSRRGGGGGVLPVHSCACQHGKGLPTRRPVPTGAARVVWEGGAAHRRRVPGAEPVACAARRALLSPLPRL